MADKNKEYEDFDFDEMMEEIEDIVESDDEANSRDIITEDLHQWMETNNYSPKNFYNNVITDIINSKSGFVEFVYDAMPDDENIMICNATIKELGYPIQSIKKKSEDELKPSTLFLYGHNYDIQDNYKSRFDSELTRLFMDDIDTKFKNVCLYGAFESIESMKNVVDDLYSKLINPMLGGSVIINLESRVKDEENNERTISNLLSTKYINSISTKVPVKFMYKKVNKSITAPLFTDTVQSEEVKTVKTKPLRFEDYPPYRPT